MTAPAPTRDPRRQELSDLVRAIADGWSWAHAKWPTRYPPATRYLARMRALVVAGKLDEALVEARRDYATLCWPCRLPPEAGVDEHGRPTRRGPADRRASRRGERGEGASP